MSRDILPSGDQGAEDKGRLGPEPALEGSSQGLSALPMGPDSCDCIWARERSYQRASGWIDGESLAVETLTRLIRRRAVRPAITQAASLALFSGEPTSHAECFGDHAGQFTIWLRRCCYVAIAAGSAVARLSGTASACAESAKRRLRY